MKRVVITGIGVVSPLGNNKSEVTKSLHDTKSGISFDESYQKMGFRSQVSGQININLEDCFSLVRIYSLYNFFNEVIGKFCVHR